MEVATGVRSLRMEPVRTSFESPWQNGVAERWVESCRRDLLDHRIALNERHLKRLLAEYVRYYHEDRTHLGLEKGTPHCRSRTLTSGRVISDERLGGLHHRYDRVALLGSTLSRVIYLYTRRRPERTPTCPPEVPRLPLTEGWFTGCDYGETIQRCRISNSIQESQLKGW